ncbi:MAG: internal scaffolding protein [Microviridae sp.]|nr:MAG: internal scaffolding protein [Microviridae sp.]
MSKSKLREHRRVRTVADIDGRTHQSFQAECDIRNIMSQYKRTGVVNHVTSLAGRFDDISEIPSFHEAMNVIAESKETFLQLPSSLRKRFNNDPAEFLDFVHNPDSRDEMIKLGMINPPKEDVSNIITKPESKDEGTPVST